MTVGPFYLELYGEAAMGKTHQSHSGSPDPVHFDTANTSMDFGEFEIERDPERRGESWDVIHKKVYGWDEEEAEDHYRYITSYEQSLNQLKDLDGFSTVILDNWYDYRTLIVDYLIDEFPNLVQDRGWPKESGWGKANDLYREFVDAVLETGRHLLVISEMKDEYVNGDKTGGRVRAGPSRSQFDCDFRFRLIEKEMEDGPRRECIVKKNRWLDRYSKEWVESLGSEYDFETLMAVSQIPEQHWRGE